MKTLYGKLGSQVILLLKNGVFFEFDNIICLAVHEIAFGKKHYMYGVHSCMCVWGWWVLHFSIGQHMLSFPVHHLYSL